MFAAAAPEGLVLDSAAGLIEGVVAEAHDVERVRDLLSSLLAAPAPEERIYL